MRLNIKERLLLLNILPKETNFITLKIVKNLQEALSFTEEEIKNFDLRNEEFNGQVLTKWNAEIDTNTDITIGEKANEIITISLKKLDEEKKLTMDFIDLFEKFTI